MPISYHTVYDLGGANPPWKLGLAFAFCAVALLLWRRAMRAQHGPLRHWAVRACILLGAGGAVIAATYEPASRRELRSALQSGSNQTVEGMITDYTVADAARHTPEHFTVQAPDASHYTFIIRPNQSSGFHATQATGTPLHKSQCVRLAVVGGAIARVEIADHCPSG